jgi:hypothetical protein
MRDGKHIDGNLVEKSRKLQAQDLGPVHPGFFLPFDGSQVTT